MKLPYTLTFIALSVSTAFTAEVDPAFAAQVNGTVHALSIDASGKVLVGGEFNEINGAARQNLARLEANGTLDATFALSADGAVLTLCAGENGATYLGGAFNSPNRHLARLLPNGDLDTTLSLGASTSSRIDCLAVGSDGSAAFGGPFRRLNGAPAVYVGKVNAAGAADATFTSSLQPNFSMEAGADAIALQPDGKIVLGGNVSTESGFAYLVRLNADGSLDTTFSGDHGPILYTKAIIVLENGQLLVAGVANSSGDGFVRRLNADGSVDASFAAAGFDGGVEAIALDADGGVFVGGSFSGGLTHLNANGSSNSDWNISTDGTVKAFALQSDNAMLVGGVFTTIGDLAQASLARIKLPSKNHGLFATNANGRFQARIQGEAGKSYEIQASSNLADWSPIGTATANENGIEITDSAAGARKHRFFRARLLN